MNVGGLSTPSRLKIFSSPGTSASGGVAILFKKSLDEPPTLMEVDPRGRFLYSQVVCDRQTYHLTNVYAPSGGNIHIQRVRDDMFKSLADTLPKPEKGDISVLVGDFNMTVYPQDREYTPKQPYKCVS